MAKRKKFSEKVNNFQKRAAHASRILFKVKKPVKAGDNKIIVAGWEASGSTFIHQVVKLLGYDIKRIHGLAQNYTDRMLFPFRDIRDVILSHAKRAFGDVLKEKGMEEALLVSTAYFKNNERDLELYKASTMPNVILIRYENFFQKNEEYIIRFLADQCLLKIDEDTVKKILEETSIDKNIKRAEEKSGFEDFDKDWMVHGNHVSNKGKKGGWRDEFTDKVKEKVKEDFGQLLIDLSYEKDLNW